MLNFLQALVGSVRSPMTMISRATFSTRCYIMKRSLQNLGAVVGGLLAAIVGFLLLAPQAGLNAFGPFGLAGTGSNQSVLPQPGQVIHAVYHLIRNTTSPAGQSQGWGAPNQIVETWRLVSDNQEISKIYNRTSDGLDGIVNESYFDGAGRMFQYWKNLNELWIEPATPRLPIAPWSAEAIGQELTNRGYSVKGERQLANYRALVMELQTSEPLPEEWLPSLPQAFRSGHLVRRVFIGQTPLVGLEFGHEDVVATDATNEFVLQSLLLATWEVLPSAEAAGNPFAWQPAANAKIVAHTQPK